MDFLWFRSADLWACLKLGLLLIMFVLGKYCCRSSLGAWPAKKFERFKKVYNFYLPKKKCIMFLRCGLFKKCSTNLEVPRFLFLKEGKK